MSTFIIKEGFVLQSAGKLLQPGNYYVPANEDEEKELTEVFAPSGSCTLVPTVTVAEDTTTGDTTDNQTAPEDDITVVPGVGKATQDKLAGIGITTLSQLKAAFADTSRTEELQTLLGATYDKINVYFNPVS